jgi:hypothetical protein
MAHGFGSCEAAHRGSVSQQRQEFISDGRSSGHDNDLVHPGAKALPNVACRIGLSSFDLKSNAFAVSFGHKVDGLAATHRVFLGHTVAAGPQVVCQPFLPVPVLWTAESVRIGFIDAQRRFPKAGQR